MTDEERKEVILALEPFARVALILEALSPSFRPGPYVPLYDVTPRAWPLVEDVQRALELWRRLGGA